MLSAFAPAWARASEPAKLTSSMKKRARHESGVREKVAPGRAQCQLPSSCLDAQLRGEPVAACSRCDELLAALPEGAHWNGYTVPSRVSL